VAALWVLMTRSDKRSWKWAWALLPAGVFVAWEVGSQHLYGAGHFGAVAKSRMVIPGPEKFLTLAAFISATTPCLFIPVFASIVGRVDGRRRWIVGGLAAATLAITIFVYPPLSIGVQLGLWSAVFVAWILLLDPGDASGRWLFAWLLLGLIGLAVALDWVCARFLVIHSAPLILLSVRSVEAKFSRLTDSRSFRAGSFVVLTVYGLAVASADFSQARVDWRAARWAEAWEQKLDHPGRAYYPGAALGGLGYYLRADRWQGLPPGAEVPKGSLLLIPRRTLPSFFLPEVSRAHVVAILEFRSWNPIRVFGSAVRAGFYGSVWGALPVAFSSAPLETYQLLLAE
jgi:hypothetical protein